MTVQQLVSKLQDLLGTDVENGQITLHFNNRVLRSVERKDTLQIVTKTVAFPEKCA